MTKLIGLTGQIGAGKDTVAEILQHNHGFEKMAFADRIRLALRAIFDCDETVFIDRRLKENEIYYGMTPRDLMISLGSDWGRNISKNLWVDLLKEKMLMHLHEGVPVVISDVRFENEAEMILENGGEIWEILRPNNPYESHSNSLYLPKHLISKIIYNAYDIDALKDMVENALCIN